MRSLAVAFLLLASCAEPMDPAPYDPKEMASEVRQIMCGEGQPKERAEALSRVVSYAEEREAESVSQDVYDEASTIAEQGCPPALEATAPAL